MRVGIETVRGGKVHRGLPTNLRVMSQPVIGPSQRPLDGFLKERQSSGRLESEGVFTVSSRLRYSRLQDALADSPANFVLKVIQGFVAMGASAINVSVGRGGVSLIAKNLSAIGSLRERLLSDRLAEQRDPLDDLALGVLSGIRSGFSHVEWNLEGIEAQRMSADDFEINSVAKALKASTIRFGMSKAQAFRNIFKPGSLRAVIEDAIYQRCTYAPCSMSLGFRSVPSKNVGELGMGRDVVVDVHHIPDGNGGVQRIEETGRFCYHYWGVLYVCSTALGRPTHNSPILPGPVHGVADGSRMEVAPKHSQTWGTFVLAMAHRAADGIVERCPDPKRSQLVGTAMLLADDHTPGNMLVLLHRGVLLEVIHCDLGSPRAVIIADAEGLDLDASTLQVVRNAKLADFVREQRRLTEFLLREISARQAFRPRGTEGLWRNLYGS